MWIFAAMWIIRFCCHNARSYALYMTMNVCVHVASSTCMPRCFHFSPKCSSLFGENNVHTRRYLWKKFPAKPQGRRFERIGNVALSEWVRLTFLHDWNMEAGSLWVSSHSHFPFLSNPAICFLLNTGFLWLIETKQYSYNMQSICSHVFWLKNIALSLCLLIKISYFLKQFFFL